MIKYSITYKILDKVFTHTIESNDEIKIYDIEQLKNTIVKNIIFNKCNVELSSKNAVEVNLIKDILSRIIEILKIIML